MPFPHKALTVVFSESELLLVFVSSVVELTEAVFVIVPARVGVPTIVTVAVAAFAIFPSSH